jgi:NADPH:quinone reductase
LSEDIVKAVIATEKGAELRDLPKPTPASNEILIRARASSLNRADLLAAIRGGGARLGLECAGEVEAVGAEVKSFRPGDRVLASAAGGFAEYVVTDAGAHTAFRPTT